MVHAGKILPVLFLVMSTSYPGAYGHSDTFYGPAIIQVAKCICLYHPANGEKISDIPPAISVTRLSPTFQETKKWISRNCAALINSPQEDPGTPAPYCIELSMQEDGGHKARSCLMIIPLRKETFGSSFDDKLNELRKLMGTQSDGR